MRAEALPSAIAPECPRCCSGPLRFIASSDCRDSTGGGVYVCHACRWTTARDQLVKDMLHQIRQQERLFEDFARLALPRLSKCASEHGTDGDGVLELLALLREMTANP